MTVAAIEGSAPAIALALPFEKASVWHARRRLAMDLRTVGVPEDRIEDAVLILSELFGNALRHARPLPPGMVRVAWSFLPGAVEISVTDGGGPTHPRVLNLPVSALGGRGLAIVSDLSATWGVRREGRGTTVYAVLSLR